MLHLGPSHRRQFPRARPGSSILARRANCASSAGRRSPSAKTAAANTSGRQTNARPRPRQRTAPAESRVISPRQSARRVPTLQLSAAFGRRFCRAASARSSHSAVLLDEALRFALEIPAPRRWSPQQSRRAGASAGSASPARLRSNTISLATASCAPSDRPPDC